MKKKVMLKAKNPHTLKSDNIIFIIDEEKIDEYEKACRTTDNTGYILANIEFCKDGKRGLFSKSQAIRAYRFIESCYNYLGIYNLSLHKL